MYRLNVQLEDEQERFLKRLEHGMKRLLIKALLNYAIRRVKEGDSIHDIIKENSDV